MNELISIVVPIYNAETFLDRCITSIIKQSYKDIEIYLIDDGSKDNSFQICQQYQKSDSRIKLIRKENGGVTSARKLGVENSIGKWIMFVDADDELYPDTIEILYSCTKTGKYDIIKGGVKAYPESTKWKCINQEGVYNRDEYVSATLLKNFFTGSFAHLYSKELFSSESFNFPRQITIGEDVLMNIELATRTTKVIVIKQEVYKYYMIASSTTHTTYLSCQYHEEYMNIVKSLLKEKTELFKKEIDTMYAKAYTSALSDPRNTFSNRHYMQLKEITKELSIPGLPLYAKHKLSLLIYRFLKRIKNSI